MTTESNPADYRNVIHNSRRIVVVYLLLLTVICAVPISAIAQSQSTPAIHVVSAPTVEEGRAIHFTAHISRHPRPVLGKSISESSVKAHYQEPYYLLWDFGDGTPKISSDERPSVSHTYGQQGDYTVKVELYSLTTGVLSHHTRVISVKNAAPRIIDGIAALNLAHTPRAFELSTQVMDTPKDILTYSWSFGDGTTKEGVDLWRTNHHWSADGHYEVTLKVRDGDGGEDSSSTWVSVGSTENESRVGAADATAGQSVSAATTSFVAEVSGGIDTIFDGHIEPMAGLYLNSIRPGVCRFMMTAWDPTQLANVTLTADLPNLKPGGVGYELKNPDIYLKFQNSPDIYREQKGLLTGGGKMGGMLSGISRLTALLDGTPKELKEDLGVDPITAPGHPPDLRAVAGNPPFGTQNSFGHRSGTLQLSVITHDRAEGEFNLILEDVRRKYLPLPKSDPPLRDPITFRGTFTLNLQTARGEGMVRYQDCMTDSFAISGTWPEDNERHLSLSTAPKVSFDSPYDPDTLDESTFKVGYFDTASEFVPVAGRIVRTEMDATFVPVKPLLDGVHYEVRMTTGANGVHGRNGEPLGNPTKLGHHAWTFSTRVDFTSARPGNLLACHVFQTVRDAPLVKRKPTVARIYAEWTPHLQVSPDHQVTSFDAIANLGDMSPPLGVATRQEFVRPDLFPASSRKYAKHTANIFGWLPSGREGPQIPATLKVTTTPGNWEAVYDTRCPAEYWDKEHRFRIDYYTVEGLPKPEKSDKTESVRNKEVESAHHAVYKLGEQYAMQLFPLQAIIGRSKGVMRIGKAARAEGLNARRKGARNVKVNSVLIGEIAARYANEYTSNADMTLVFIHRDHQLGGKMVNHVWGNGRGVAYMGMDNNVDEQHTYVQGWVHEMGHVLGLPHLPVIGNTEEQDEWADRGKAARGDTDDLNYDGIEGFRIAPSGRTGWNKSSTEGNAESNSLAPLMLPGVVGVRHQFIATHHYHQIQDAIDFYIAETVGQQSSPFQTASLASTGWMFANSSSRAADRYVSIGGIIDDSDDILFLGPLTRIQKGKRDENGGDYTLALLDAADGLLTSSSVAVPPAADGRPHRSFSSSVRWDDSAKSLVLLRGTTVLARLDRTASAPKIEVKQPDSGDTAGDEITLRWSASDADGDPLTATILYSPNGLDEWSTKALWLEESSFVVDTSTLEPGPKPTFRVMVSDGFDEASDQVTVEVRSGLRILSALPSAEVAADPRDDIVLMLNSGLTSASVASARATLREGTQAATKAGIHYEESSRAVRVIPDAALKAATRYQVTLEGKLQDGFGNRLKTPYTWSFNTAADPD